ncbi:MAG: TonB-dependent receptor plug domain-containing protein, partial [Daejeonella sp.]|uniref:TonB-dependent receptor plug domain-containing protein n=1 Tax=Daejeonella sp. TaxID=2805397 RepID=UPI003C766E38
MKKTNPLRWRMEVPTLALACMLSVYSENPAFSALKIGTEASSFASKSALFKRAVIWPISGRITSADGQPLPGVSILVRGTSNGVTTDMDGRYTINVPENAGTLVYTFIGFTTQEKSFSGPATINIVMSEDSKSLQEVVVTGYNSQAKRDITGAVTTVSAKDLLSAPATNVAQALQGRAAGVTVGNENSPGGGVMVRVRGFGTINDNSPLYVIDGVPTKGNLNTLNPNDIESMQILKDASSASIYGARAGNGVVIITTKKGKNGEPKITFDSYYGTQQRGPVLDLLNTNELAQLTWESERNAGNLKNGNPSNPQYGNSAQPVIPDFIFPTGASSGDPRVSPANYTSNIDDSEFNKTKFLITPANKEGTRWMEEIFNPAPM